MKVFENDKTNTIGDGIDYFFSAVLGNGAAA